MIQEWLRGDLSRRKSLTGLPGAQFFDAYLGSLRPFTDSYASLANPVFLPQIPMHQEPFHQRPLWLARDGWVSLAWFFRFHPSPPFRPPVRMNGPRILVAEEFLSLVPDPWKPL